MLTISGAFSTFAVRDLDSARRFYGDQLGLDVRDEPRMGLLELHVGRGEPVTIYPKPDHQPAVFTILNFLVDDIDRAVSELNAAGIEMQRYDSPESGMTANEHGVYRGQGPAIAWFLDPAGNILAVIERPR
jgi:catechol 2,3-dioxygenase-like lactoylglutathione lyase family enzyme